MKKIFKVNIVFVLIPLLFCCLANIKNNTASAYEDTNCKASVLIERNSNAVLHEKNAHDRLPIASVTKLMTILLTFEKIDCGEISLDDKVCVSKNASGMGGSQIFLDADTDYTLCELLKSVIVASANDSSVALAEYIAGSENNFVQLMNERAKELGLTDTNYANCTGLPTVNAYSSAYDQAIILNKVLNFDLYHEYSSIWFEDFVHPSGRTTSMTNTNKLSRYYAGCLGGKTGSTSEAKYCLAVGAKRDETEIISVVLGADSTKDRFKIASDLLNYGFDNFYSKTLFSNNDLKDLTVPIKGQNRIANLYAEREAVIIVKKNEDVNFSLNYNLPNMLKSVKKGDVVGNVEVVVDGEVIDTINICSLETHDEASVWDYFLDLINE